MKLFSFEEQVGFLQTITHAIAKASDFKSITQNVLEQLCNNTEFIIGQVWLRSSFQHKKMHFVTEYHEMKKHDPFSKRARKMEFRKGEGLPGLIWKENRHKWIEDIEQLEQFAPTGKTKEAAVKTAFASPVPYGKKVLGVLILYLGEKRKEDPRHVALISTIAMQLGVYLKLTMAEDKLLKQYDRLKNKFKKKEDDLNQIIGNLEQFSYIVSHDLRSPLRAIQALTDLLYADYHPSLNEEGKELVEKIKETVNRTDKMINDLLEFSRAGILKAEKETINMADVINNVTSEIKASYKAKIDTRNEFPKVNYYSTSMRQILINLLKNAIEHNDKEMPKIEIGGKKQPGGWRFYVKDNGPGIPENIQEKIFQPFESFNTKTRDNTGLGLAIVKKNVEKMGGEVWVDSKEGEGATFWFSIPGELIK